METKKLSTRGRPKKDFWELKEKINKEAAENKWKLWRWRPKKEKKIDDSINTKISNHHKDIKEIEKRNNEIHKDISNISKDFDEVGNNKKERYSKIILAFSIVFFICAVVYAIVFRFVLPSLNWTEKGVFSTDDNENVISMQIWYNDQSWEFVEMENIEIDSNNNNNDQVDTPLIDENIWIIQSFYDKINNREFSELSKMADSYLKKSDSFRSYYNEYWLSKFLDKIVWNKIYIWWFRELPSTKPDVQKYWEIAIVNRNWEILIWSIMCVTTWCSRMPFFQP